MPTVGSSASPALSVNPKSEFKNHMTTTLLLIRHGQTDYNLNGRWQGHLDIPLNETGKAQAQALARRLAAWPVTAVYASDLTRTTQTAVPLAETWGLPLISDSAWRERHVGVFEGRSGEELRQAYPDVWANRRNGIIDIPDGEQHEALQARAVVAYQKILTAHPAEMIAVVSHGGTLNALVSALLGIPSNHFGRLNFRGNTGLTIIEVNQYGPHLTMLNDIRHLENGDFYG
jgi:probable phosphoglycerate mutase